MHAMVSVFQFIMKQSYICALIAMMVCMHRVLTSAQIPAHTLLCPWDNVSAGGMDSAEAPLAPSPTASSHQRNFFIFLMSWQTMADSVNFSWDLYTIDFKTMSASMPLNLMLNINTCLSN